MAKDFDASRSPAAKGVCDDGDQQLGGGNQNTVSVPFDALVVRSGGGGLGAALIVVGEGRRSRMGEE